MKSRRGDAMIGMLLSTFLALFIFQILFDIWKESEKTFEQRMVIEQMSLVGKALRGYMEANNGVLVKDPTITTDVATSKTLNLSDAAVKTLLQPYFPAGMTVGNLPSRNVWGDTYRILLVRSPSPDGNVHLDTITGYLYTIPGAFSRINRTVGSVEGTKFINLGQKKTAFRGGALFGWSPTAGTLEGLSWKLEGVPGLLPGYLGYIVGFGDKADSLTALQRFDSGDPELNRMHTSIDMNKFDIDNVSSVRFQPSTASLATWQSDCVNNQRTNEDGTVDTGVDNVGRIFFSHLGDSADGTIGNTTLAICRQMGGSRGLAFIGDSATEDSIRFVMAVSDGETVPKPICPGSTAFGNPSGGANIDGDKMFDGLSHARIFVLPQVISSGPESRAIGAVKVWAVDNGTDWTVRINTLVKDGADDVWAAGNGVHQSPGALPSKSKYRANVPAESLKVVVMGICSAKVSPF